MYFFHGTCEENHECYSALYLYFVKVSVSVVILPFLISHQLFGNKLSHFGIHSHIARQFLCSSNV
jgi:hypothetical protein